MNPPNPPNTRRVVITPRKLSESQLRLARSRAAVDMMRERAADLTHSMGEPGVDALRRLAQPECYGRKRMSPAEWSLICQFAQFGMSDAWLLYNERCEFHAGPEQAELRRMVEGPPIDPSPASIVTAEE
ncbi:MAG TPA: hypothetical protein PLW65_26185, partial [Pseudomonadota bacterium]|nr:hypothetical protein [Pseudomonadota bacterium]